MRSNELITAALLALVAGLGSACTSGGGGCSLNGGTVLANAPWPKFRSDAGNTGRSSAVISDAVSEATRLFPQVGQIDSISATPIIGRDHIYLASTDSNVYVLDFNGTQVMLAENIQTFGGIPTTPLLGENGTLYVASGDGTIVQFESDGNAKRATTVGGSIVGAPNISDDGTVYVGSQAGIFSGVCPNGRSKFSLAVTNVESTAAVINDPENDKDRIIVFAQDNGEIRSVDVKGRQRWSFYVSPAGVSAAVMFDAADQKIFVADLAGRVFALNYLDGAPSTGFAFTATGPAPAPGAIARPISASLALGRDANARLYVADLAGTLYALDKRTGAVQWTFDAGRTINSSPAIATGGERDVIVIAADLENGVGGAECPMGEGGTPLDQCAIVYAIADAGNAPEVLWSRLIGAQVQKSSPSLGADGTVYIGTGGQTGVLYQIAALG
jgi:outer membrane protein assembly factor BamB